MTLKTIINIGLIVSTFCVQQVAFAYSSEKEEVLCKAPQFKGFNLPVYGKDNKTEVEPGTAIEFTVSGWTDPETIEVFAKKEPLDFTLENRNSFFRIMAKVPDSLAGQFVRIRAKAKAVLGCKGENGWLLKVANATSATQEPESTNAADSQPDSVETESAPLPPANKP